MSKSKTPLRYPGGKQKLAQFIKEILEDNHLIGGHYVEPYAGGAGIAIELLLNKLVSKIHLNDISQTIFAFWHSVLNEPEEFCRRISRASLNVDEWKRQREIFRNHIKFEEIDVGFATFYLNRCNRSGILSGGVIGGLNQNGKWKLDARFPRAELIKRIETIAKEKKHIKIKNLDAENFILKYLPKLPKQTLVYCDPPYFNKASTLYQNHYTPNNHARISELIQNSINHPWIVSYDNAPEILKHYKHCKKFIYNLQYNVAKVYKGSEVFIFSDAIVIPSNSTISFINNALKNNLFSMS
ncbi:MAG: DNA adenine methylase [Bacteroidales bacterium]|jgi:DNA adenine methylase|nr:DNA adenine methylase [Bacteroidales bacterium]